MSLLVVASHQPGVRVIVRGVGADINHAHSSGIPDGVEAGLFASSGVGEDFSDLQPGESSLEIGEVGGEESRIRAGGGATGPR